jgi:hypothetical protein
LMADHFFNANSVDELKAAFRKAEKECDIPDFDNTVYLQCTDSARAAMEEIFDADKKRKVATTAGAGAGGTGVFLTVATATAPVLGPFCVLAGGIAAAFAGKKVDDVSRGVFLGDAVKKYGEELVGDARQYSRRSFGTYRREFNNDKDYPIG